MSICDVPQRQGVAGKRFDERKLGAVVLSVEARGEHGREYDRAVTGDTEKQTERYVHRVRYGT